MLSLLSARVEIDIVSIADCCFVKMSAKNVKISCKFVAKTKKILNLNFSRKLKKILLFQLVTRKKAFCAITLCPGESVKNLIL